MNQLPPHNLEAEQCVLGSILVQEGLLEKTIGLLSPDDFYGDAHQEIYAAMLALREKNNPQDLITVANLLKERNTLERAGGPAYLAGLTHIVPFASRISHYARIVQEKAILRRLIRTTSEITSRCYEGYEDIGNLVEDARRVGDVVLSANSLPEKVDLAAAFSGPPPELDWVWPGFLAGTVGVLVAAGGTGKSYWALQAAMAVADGSGDRLNVGMIAWRAGCCGRWR
jgi:replicative DNA helicase